MIKEQDRLANLAQTGGTIVFRGIRHTLSGAAINEMVVFWQYLVTHDWYYQYSDDHRVWQAGNLQRERIFSMKKDNLLLEELFDYYMQQKDFGIRNKKLSDVIEVVDELEAA